MQRGVCLPGAEFICICLDENDFLCFPLVRRCKAVPEEPQSDNRRVCYRQSIVFSEIQNFPCMMVYRLNMFPSNSYAETPLVMIPGGGAFGRGLGLAKVTRVRPSRGDWCPYNRKSPDHRMRGQQESTVICKPGSGPHPKPHLHYLDLGLARPPDL